MITRSEVVPLRFFLYQERPDEIPMLIRVTRVHDHFIEAFDYSTCRTISIPFHAITVGDLLQLTPRTDAMAKLTLTKGAQLFDEEARILEERAQQLRARAREWEAQAAQIES